MISVLQPQSMAMTSMSAMDQTAKMMEKQVHARQISVASSGSFMDNGTSSVSLDSMVEAALEADPAYGLVSSMTTQDAAEHYSSTARILGMYYGSDKSSVPVLDIDI